MRMICFHCLFTLALRRGHADFAFLEGGEGAAYYRMLSERRERQES